MNVWRLQTNTDSKDGHKIADYCLENKVIAIGWSFKDKDLPIAKAEEIRELRKKIVTIQDYRKIVKAYNLYTGRGIHSVYRLQDDLKENDLVWLRNKGVYYLGRVEPGSSWQYCCDNDALDKDASNQRTCVHWLPIGTEGDVPGAVTTSLIRGTTFQKIKKSGVLEYSQLLYNKYSETETYKVDGLDNTEQSFYSLLSTEDCEDLLCLWLYAKYGYITIPSSNKKSTELYECQLKNPANGDNIYVQVKVNSTIDAGK